MRDKPMARRGVALIATCALLTACGQRGALYLPEESRNVVVTPAPTAAPAAPAASPADAAATPDTEEQRRRNTTAPAR